MFDFLNLNPDYKLQLLCWVMADLHLLDPCFRMEPSLLAAEMELQLTGDKSLIICTLLNKPATKHVANKELAKELSNPPNV